MAATGHQPGVFGEFIPYVGPRPFRETEADRFYGRDVAAQAVLDAWPGERVTILHGPSAVGKTSLLNAAVLPAVSDQPDAVVLPVGSLATLAAPATPATGLNRYIRALLSHWSRSATADVLYVQIRDFITAELSSFSTDDDDRIILAAIDHFEELFTESSADPSDRDEFIAQLVATIRKIPALRLLLVINDEHLVSLRRYEHQISLFRPRYVRLDPLSPEDALAAITRPLIGTGRSFSPGTAEDLVQKLGTASRTNDDQTSPVDRTEAVEPLFLQLVCRDMWTSLDEGTGPITADMLHSAVDIDEAIARFYDSAVQAVHLLTSEPEEKLRAWIESAFITEYGTKSAVCRGVLTTAGLPNQVAEAFADARVLVTEYRSRSTWYRLGHERMIAGIRKANSAWAGTQDAEAAASARSVLPDELIKAATAALEFENFSIAHSFAERVAGCYRETGDLRRLGYALSLQASIANAEGDYQRAEGYLHDALSKFSILEDRNLVTHTLSALGDISFAEGSYAKAGELYQAAVDQLPTYSEAMIGLGFAEWYAGSPADAEATFALAQGQHASSARAAGGRGQVLAELSEYDRALCNLDAALESGLPFEEEVDARSARALALTMASRPEEADKELASALRQAPDRARTHRRAGKIAALRQQHELAVVEFQRALEAKPPLPPWDEDNARRYLAQLLDQTS
jgi:tetratricopeptide (TPR) repeat protein